MPQAIVDGVVSIDAFVSGQAMSQIYAGRTLGRVNDSLPDQVQNARGATMPTGPVGGDVGLSLPHGVDGARPWGQFLQHNVCFG